MGFFFVLIIAAVVIYVSYQSSQQAKEKWRAAAQSLHLSYIPGDLMNAGKIQGTRNGHHVKVTTFSKSSGKSSQTYTKYQVVYRNRIPFDLKITRQGAMFAVKQLFGYQDVELGDSVFDSKVVVRSAQPERAKKFLDSEIRALICGLVTSYPTVEITNEHVMVTKTGRDIDPSVIGHCVRRLEAFCENMVDGKQRTPASKPTPAPETDVKPRPVYEINEAPSATPIVEVVDLEGNSAAFGVAARAPNVVELEVNPLDTMPLPEDVAEPEKVETAPVLEEQPEPQDPAEPVDIKAVAEALYGGDASSSLAANGLFAEHYENRKVTGRGALKRVGKFSYDPVFKDMKGAKATLEICQIAGAYSKIKVKAEIAFPADRFAELKAREGASLAITGTLIAQDSMMNQLYILAD